MQWVTYQQKAAFVSVTPITLIGVDRIKGLNVSNVNTGAKGELVNILL